MSKYIKNILEGKAKMPGVFVAGLNAHILETDANIRASFQRCTYKCLHNVSMDMKHDLCPEDLFVHFSFGIDGP